MRKIYKFLLDLLSSLGDAMVENNGNKCCCQSHPGKCMQCHEKILDEQQC